MCVFTLLSSGDDFCRPSVPGTYDVVLPVYAILMREFCCCWNGEGENRLQSPFLNCKGHCDPPKSVTVTKERKLGRIALKTDSAQMGPSPFLLSQGISVPPPLRLLSGLLTLTDILFLTAAFQSGSQSHIPGPPFARLHDPILFGSTFLDGLSWWSLS